MIGPITGASSEVSAYRSGRSMYASAFPSRKKTEYSSSRTTMLSLTGMSRGARHIRLLPFATSSHAIVAMSHLRPGDHVHPALERRLDVREGLADPLDAREHLARVAGGVRLELRRHLREARDAVEEERVPLVQLVHLRLEDLDVRDEAGVALLRVADLALEALRLQDHGAERLERLQLVARGQGPAGVLELPAEVLQLVRDLDPQHVVRRAKVLAAAVPGEPRDVQLDPLQQSTVFLNALAQVRHRMSSKVWGAYRIIFVTSMYRPATMIRNGKIRFATLPSWIQFAADANHRAPTTRRMTPHTSPPERVMM